MKIVSRNSNLFIVLFVFILGVVSLFSAKTVASAHINNGNFWYMPQVGMRTGRGPFQVRGILEFIFPPGPQKCQIVHVIELYDYDPNTGTGIFVYDTANDPGDITSEEDGSFVLNEVLDENGIPVDIPTSDWLIMVGMPDCADCYDIIESPVIKLYAGQVVNVGTVYSREVRQYCWSDPDTDEDNVSKYDNGRWLFEFETINGEMVIVGEERVE